MKRGTKLALLLAALLVLTGAWLAARNVSRQRQTVLAEQAEEENISLAAGSAEEIRALSWYYFGDAVNLRYDEQTGKWLNVEDEQCPINGEAVKPLLEAVASAEATDVIEQVTDFDQYGLAEPAIEVRAATADRETVYHIGNSNSAGTWYVRLEGENRVYLETGTLSSVFQVGLDDMLALESLDMKAEDVTALEVRSQAGDYTLSMPENALELWYTDAFPWFLTGESPQPVETEKAEELIQKAVEISLTDCVSWDREEAPEYGFGEPQAEMDIFCGGEQPQVTLQFGRYENEFVFVRLRDSSLVYQIEGTVLDSLLYPDVEAMLPLRPADLNWDLLQGMTLVLEEGTVEISCMREDPEGAGEENPVVYKAGDETLDAEKVASWLEQVRTLPAESRTEKQAGRGSLFSLLFRQDNKAFPQVTVEFYTYDSVCHLCVVNGEEYYLVSRTAADAVARDTGEFLRSGETK